MSDIRLDIGFLDHPKTIKLIRKLGWDKGVQSLLRLWCFAAQYKCDGNLGDVIEDIEIAAHWVGEPGEFVKTLLDIGYIEQNGHGLLLHDWQEHNGWAFFAEQRKEQARHAAYARWKRKRVRKNADSNATSITTSNAPSPSPSPSPSPKRLTIPPLFSDVEQYCKERNKGIDAQKWFDHYSSNGWMVGKNKMKDWQAAIRTWEKNNESNMGTDQRGHAIEPPKRVIFSSKNSTTGWREKLQDGTETDCQPPAGR